MTRFIKSTLIAGASLLSLAGMASAQSAAATAETFFDHYNDQNVPAMIALFEPEGVVEYVPFNLSGPVEAIGPGS